MCRMLAAAGEASTLRLLRLLSRAFLSAVERDKLLAPVYGGYRHCDGYGYVVAVWRAGSETPHIAYVRHDTLSCSENLSSLRRSVGEVLELAARGDKYIVVLHARKAGRGEPRGPLHAHPYRVEVETPNGPLELYVAHNGGMDKEELAATLGLPPARYTDSHLAALYLARSLSEGSTLLEAYRSLKRYVKETSALDTAAMLWPRLYLTGYVRPREEHRYRYYQPFMFEGDRIIGYVSSTVKQYADGLSLPLEYREIQGVFVEVDARSLEYKAENL